MGEEPPCLRGSSRLRATVGDRRHPQDTAGVRHVLCGLGGGVPDQRRSRPHRGRQAPREAHPTHCGGHPSRMGCRRRCGAAGVAGPDTSGPSGEPPPLPADPGLPAAATGLRALGEAPAGARPGLRGSGVRPARGRRRDRGGYPGEYLVPHRDGRLRDVRGGRQTVQRTGDARTRGRHPARPAGVLRGLPAVRLGGLGGDRRRLLRLVGCRTG